MRFLALLLALAFPLSTFAQAPLPPEPRTPPLLLGAAWYPEQWDEATWESDLTLMEQAHIHFVRVGEFAWSTMEPSEGNFQLDWLAHAASKIAARGWWKRVSRKWPRSRKLRGRPGAILASVTWSGRSR